jgi:hypothetical protein
MADNQVQIFVILARKIIPKTRKVFLNSKKLLAKKTSSGVRYFKNIGLGFKTPKEAIESRYIDKKCPFTSNVSIRGQILKGICHIHKNAKNYCREKRLSSTMFPNTIDTRRDTEIFQYTAHLPSQSKKEILLLSVNADLSLRLSISTFSRLFPMKLSVM